MRNATTVVCLLGIALCGAGAVWAAEQVHGENSEFAGQGVAMAWAILKAPMEDQSQVVVRIARLDPRYVALSIDGVDPFTGARRELLKRTALPDVFETRTTRGTFAELTRREFHFYRQGDAVAAPPALTIYFMGVPDTAPEFLSEAALRGYLDQTLAKLAGSNRRAP